MENKKLYIFVSSKESDPYINSICHGIENENVKEVCLLDVIPEPGKRKEQINFLSELIEKIYSQFANLKNGNYQPSRGDLKLNVIDDIGQSRYNEYVTILPKNKISYEVILYNELSEVIGKIIENRNCLFDVTPTSKNYLIDIFSVIISNNYRHIYYFELLQDGRKYDQTELIHALTKDRTYRYDNVTDGKFTKGKKFIDETFNTKVFDALKEDVTHYYAMQILTWIFIGSCIMLFFLYKMVPWVSNQWNSLEPLTFILGTLMVPVITTYIAGIAYIILFRKELPDFTPWKLYLMLKQIKIDQIEKL